MASPHDTFQFNPVWVCNFGVIRHDMTARVIDMADKTSQEWRIHHPRPDHANLAVAITFMAVIFYVYRLLFVCSSP